MVRDTEPETPRETEKSGQEWCSDAQSPRQRLERDRMSRDAPRWRQTLGGEQELGKSRGGDGSGGGVSAWGRGSRRGAPMRTHVPHAGVTTRPQLKLKRAGLELRAGLRPGGTETRRD